MAMHVCMRIRITIKKKQAFEPQLGRLQKGAGNTDWKNMNCVILVVQIWFMALLQVRAALTPQEQESKYSQTQYKLHTVASFQ